MNNYISQAINEWKLHNGESQPPKWYIDIIHKAHKQGIEDAEIKKEIECGNERGKMYEEGYRKGIEDCLEAIDIN